MQRGVRPALYAVQQIADEIALPFRHHLAACFSYTRRNVVVHRYDDARMLAQALKSPIQLRFYKVQRIRGYDFFKGRYRDHSDCIRIRSCNGRSISANRFRKISQHERRLLWLKKAFAIPIKLQYAFWHPAAERKHDIFDARP